jgi:hypothetical protein
MEITHAKDERRRAQMLGMLALIMFLASGPIFAASAHGSQVPTGFGLPGDNSQAAADRILGEIESFMDAQPAIPGGRE